MSLFISGFTQTGDVMVRCWLAQSSILLIDDVPSRLHVTSLHFICFTSLQFTSFPVASLDVAPRHSSSFSVTSLHSTFQFSSVQFPSLLFTSLHCTAPHQPSRADAHDNRFRAVSTHANMFDASE